MHSMHSLCQVLSFLFHLLYSYTPLYRFLLVIPLFFVCAPLQTLFSWNDFRILFLSCFVTGSLMRSLVFLTWAQLVAVTTCKSELTLNKCLSLSCLEILLIFARLVLLHQSPMLLRPDPGRQGKKLN